MVLPETLAFYQKKAFKAFPCGGKFQRILLL